MLCAHAMVLWSDRIGEVLFARVGQGQLGSREKTWREVGSLRRSVISAQAIPWTGLRNRQPTPLGVGRPLPLWVRFVGQQSCAASEAHCWRGAVTCGFAILTKWFSLTRLETRTKESNIYASVRVQNPRRAMKVKAV